LFVRNVSYNTSERTLIGLFEKYGEIKRVFNLIDKRGMAFITYVRHAHTSFFLLSVSACAALGALSIT
jgi:RNA recognition motif-containing protein